MVTKRHEDGDRHETGGDAAGDPAPATARELADPLKLAAISAFLQPWRWMFHPVFHGLENIPDDAAPALRRQPHSLRPDRHPPALRRALEPPPHLPARPGRPRPLPGAGVARPAHLGRRRARNARELRDADAGSGEAIVVFPGGAREVFKRRSEKYKLLWKERYGFAKLAIEHGCTVVPFASVGVEDAYDIVLDRDDYLATPLGRLAAWLGLREDAMMPIARGIGPTPIPRPARIYFRILPPIGTGFYGGSSAGADAALDLRDRTHDAIERGIAELRDEQGHDPEAVRFSTIFGPLRHETETSPNTL